MGPARQDILADRGLGEDSASDQDEVEALMAQTIKASTPTRQAEAVLTDQATTASPKRRSNPGGRGLGLRLGSLSLGRGSGRGVATGAGNRIAAQGPPDIARMASQIGAGEIADSDGSEDI